jgi:HlyD family secretion protein
MSEDNTPQSDQGASLKQLLNNKSPGRFPSRRLWLAGAVILIAVAAFFFFRTEEKKNAPRYNTEPVETGTLVVRVTATGNLEPTNQVDVGSELSGTVSEVYVDDDDRVTKGQVLAQLDRSKFEDAVAKSKAAVAVAEANLQQARATVVETRTKLARYRKVAELSGGQVPSQTEMDTAQAELARAEADVASAKASIAEANATLRSNETDLGKTRIRSPINGVVLERSVDPGQAVAASLQAVTLFTLAEDLSKMELKVDVDEADVGQVKAGLKATFTVDAWPNRVFQALITRVGFNATDDDGVISYPAVLQVTNDDLSLRPGMTGTAEIITLTHENALLVPNAALRFTPPETGTDQKKSSGSVLRALMPRPPRQAHKVKTTAVASSRVWVLQNGQPAAVEVQAGATNGRMTEILGGALKNGMEVITETLSTTP